ncbi:STAS/SEC14 domain-containing protein [Archangium violaceum]|uniref:DUF7793 family protein n=1 Tax=Archangium violaceum TaxID=83451 RepID=UPI00194E2D6A|nr:STAS/SEC14 domain-containing protein [Archangium violaceum]QRN98541.1 STAS/SEC14 domain-containing protein [Archangium violaceum]
MTAPREWSIGTHYIRFEQPDTLFIKIKGDIGLEEVKQLVDICRELAEKKPFYLITDLAEIGTIPSEARGYASKNIRQDWYLGVAYIGANFVAKAAAKGLALMMYFTGKPSFDLEFVHDENEARAALSRQRLKRATTKVA